MPTKTPLSQKTIPSLADILSVGGRLVNGAYPKDHADYKDDIKIHLMGTATTDMLARAISVACLQENLFPTITQSLYGSFVQDALNNQSDIYATQPDIIFIISDWQSLVEDIPPNASHEEVLQIVDNKAAEILALWQRITSKTQAKILYHFPPTPSFRLTGIAENYLPASYSNQMRLLLSKLWENNIYNVQILDMMQFSLEHGYSHSFAPRIWYSAKLPIENSSLPAYVPLIRSAIRGARNKLKKVLVLDLDNTIWGGVIGDDGVDGIRLGNGDAVSEAYLAFQAYIKHLASRGIILAICSKNNLEIAKLGLAHAEGILKLEDFAAIECSWNDKATGLRNIAQHLNLGLDALVFADDNPAECALITQELPEVAVVHLDGDPANFISQIEAGYWFQFQQYSSDDFQRTQAYAARTAALIEQRNSVDLPTYLRNLQMVGTIHSSPTPKQLERMAQLSQKTNQFNLVTSRYDEKDITQYSENKSDILIAGSLKDKFGDHGLVSFIAGKNENSTILITEWVMSCRVFSRTFEQFMFNNFVREAQKIGGKIIIGEYKETSKNGIVSSLYTTLGFSKKTDYRWILDITAPLPTLETFITSI